MRIGPKLRWLAFMVFLVLAGCATPPPVPGQTPLQQHIAIAEDYVTTGFRLVDICIAAPIPLCKGAAFLAGVEKAKAIAREALAESKQQAADGADPDLVQTTLRISMNAVLLFYSLR
jgi:hypothetical protein